MDHICDAYSSAYSAFVFHRRKKFIWVCSVTKVNNWWQKCWTISLMKASECEHFSSPPRQIVLRSSLTLSGFGTMKGFARLFGWIHFLCLILRVSPALMRDLSLCVWFDYGGEIQKARARASLIQNFSERSPQESVWLTDQNGCCSFTLLLILSDLPVYGSVFLSPLLFHRWIWSHLKQ